MKANGSTNHDMFEDFEPYCLWHRFADREILEVHLQGFKKEDLRVQVINKNILSVSGDRPLNNNNNKRSRFEKKIELPNYINIEEIQAKLGDRCYTLTLVMPKKLNLIQNPKQSNGDDIASGCMKWSNGIGTKVMKFKKMGPMVAAVVVSAAVVVGLGAFIAHKYGPKYPFEH